MPGIGVIANPHSRANRKNPERLAKIAYIVGDRGAYAATHNIDDVYRVAEDFKKNGIDILALSGGDGTNHHTLTAFIKVYGDTPLPKVAILRGGTMNTVAGSVGIRGETHQLLASLVEKYSSGEPFSETQRTLMQVGESYGFLFGNGLAISFLDEYYAGGNASPLKAFTTLARSVGSVLTGGELAKRLFTPIECTLVADGNEWPQRRFTSVMCGSIDDIGLGFRPFFRSSERPGIFHICGILPDGWGVVVSLPAIFRAQAPAEKYIVNGIAAELFIRSQQPLPYMVDGDSHAAVRELRIAAGPRLTLVTG